MTGTTGAPGAPEPILPGTEIPSWTMSSVDPARMRTMAAILRDPYPVHWDRDANAAIGIPGRVVNQGPLNLGYIVNMLMAWAGPASVRRLTVRFHRPVLDGDHVVAGGRVVAVDEVDGERRATCEVWLRRIDPHGDPHDDETDGETVVEGSAVVAIAEPPRSYPG